MVREDTTTIQRKLRQVAKELDGWTYKPPDQDGWYAGDFCGPDGMEIGLSFANQRYGKLRAFGDMNRFRGVQHDSVRIGFSVFKRSACSLAADITRRLIEPYKRAWKEASERLAAHQAEEGRKARLVDSLLEILGPEAHRWKHKEHAASCLHSDPDDSKYLSIEFVVRSSVEFKLRVSPDLAERLCRLLAQETGRGVR